ncbi:hypothetical protein B0H13DRAFT_1890896 [Mycena leptocephala]|nr:hypothetical protein B0H13DRAFT_1890896 [Mycena leptocephala]
MLSTFGMGIVGATVFDGAAGMTQITFGLAAATNLVLAALTGKLESGAIYCIGAIFLIITVSLHDSEIYGIGIGITQQLMNVIPTFTLVYVGLKNTDYSCPSAPIPQVSSNGRTASVRQKLVYDCVVHRLGLMLVELKTRRARKRERKEAKREERYPPIDERRILTYRLHHVAKKDMHGYENKMKHIRRNAGKYSETEGMVQSADLYESRKTDSNVIM